MIYDRRRLMGILGTAAIAVPMRIGAQSREAAQGARITLLGTAGGPPPHLGRSQPASLFQVAGRSYLIDAGENVAQQLLRAGCPPPRVDMALLTHLHWDHTLGLDYLMASGWMMGRTRPMPILGPPGTSEFVRRTANSVRLGEDIFRRQTPDRPRVAALYPARDIALKAPREIHRDGDVRISAVENSHFTFLGSANHSYGKDRGYSYRFETPDGSVVFTGDTGPSGTLADFAKGAEVMVAEIVDLTSIRANLQQNGNSGRALDVMMEHMQHQHLTPEALGTMAQQAGVKKLVLSHYVLGRDFPPQAFVPQLAKYYSGEIVAGQDLTVIPLRKG